MKRNHYLILGGIALIGGYLWYKKREKSEIAKKALATITTPLALAEASNVSGTSCTCDNGFTGYCQSGDCSKCCASYNDKKRPTETRTYTFMKQSQRPNRAYGSAY